MFCVLFACKNLGAVKGGEGLKGGKYLSCVVLSCYHRLNTNGLITLRSPYVFLL